MARENGNAISMLLTFAVFCEALAVVLVFCPYGSLAALAGPPPELLRAAFVLGLTVVATALLRLVLPGPKTPALFYRSGGPSLARTLYYGFAAAVLLTFYRAGWLVALHYAGTTLPSTLPVELLRAGPLAALARIIVSLGAAYLFFGYLQGFVGGALGRRAGFLAAAALASTAAIWPAVGAPYGIGSYEPWLALGAWRLPEALALAYLGARARNVVAPLVAVFLIEWFSTMGVGIFGLFGKWPFLFACLIIFLAAVEIIVAERRRLLRAAGGFFSLLGSRSAEASLLDGVLFAAALTGAYVLFRAAGILEEHVIIAAIVGGAVFTSGLALWLFKYFRGARAKADPAGELPARSGN